MMRSSKGARKVKIGSGKTTYKYYETEESRLGKGSFGEVWRGQSRNSAGVAIKKISATMEADCEKEWTMLKQLKSPNIVQFIEVVKDGAYIYIVQELCTGDLDKYRHQLGGLLNFQQMQRLVQDMAAGYKVLFDHSVIHRDIKPKNILVSSMDTPVFKLSDFGLARPISRDERYAQTVAGTAVYQAPEIEVFHHYDARADIFSFGSTFYECLMGKYLLESQSDVRTLNMLVSDGKSDTLVFPRPEGDPQLVDMIEGMLVLDYKERMKPEEFFVHPFVVGPQRASGTSRSFFGSTFAAPSQSNKTLIRDSSDIAQVRRMMSGASLSERTAAVSGFGRGSAGAVPVFAPRPASATETTPPLPPGPPPSRPKLSAAPSLGAPPSYHTQSPGFSQPPPYPINPVQQTHAYPVKGAPPPCSNAPGLHQGHPTIANYGPPPGSAYTGPPPVGGYQPEAPGPPPAGFPHPGYGPFPLVYAHVQGGYVPPPGGHPQQPMVYGQPLLQPMMGSQTMTSGIFMGSSMGMSMQMGSTTSFRM